MCVGGSRKKAKAGVCTFPFNSSHPEIPGRWGRGILTGRQIFQGYRGRVIPELPWVLLLAACKLGMEPRPLSLRLVCPSSR